MALGERRLARTWTSVCPAATWLLGVLLMVTWTAAADGTTECTVVHSADFESPTNFSGYSNLDRDCDWRLGSGSAPKGPRGQYVYIEGGDGGAVNVSILKSPLITTNAFQEECYLKFYYNMRGKNIGSLAVFSEVSESPRLNNTLWVTSGNQHTKDGWRQALVRLVPGTAGQFYLYFKGTLIQRMGKTQRGDMAVDDISVTCCAGCSKSMFMVANFESGLSNFTQATNDNFDWTRGKGGTPTGSTRPAYDSTQGYTMMSSEAGYYMHIEASQRSTGDVATLISPLYSPAPSSDVCFISFWYNMYGQHIGSLNVSTNLSSTDTTQWCRNGRQHASGLTWARGQFWVQPRGRAFQVMLSGKRGSGRTGDIAVDDVSVSCCTEDCDFFYPVTFECGLDGFQGNWTRTDGYKDITTQMTTGNILTATEGNTSRTAYWLRNLTNVSTGGSTCNISFYVSANVSKDNALTVTAVFKGNTTSVRLYGMNSADFANFTWFEVTKSFSTPGSMRSVKIMFVTQPGAGWEKVGIDEIRVTCCPNPAATQSALPTPPSSPTTTSTSTSRSTPKSTSSSIPTTISPSSISLSTSTTISPSSALLSTSTKISPSSTLLSTSTTISQSSALLSTSTTISASSTLLSTSTAISPSSTLVSTSTTISPSSTSPSTSTTISPSSTLLSTSKTISPSSILPSISTTISPSSTLPSTSTTISPSSTLPPTPSSIIPGMITGKATKHPSPSVWTLPTIPTANTPSNDTDNKTTDGNKSSATPLPTDNQHTAAPASLPTTLPSTQPNITLVTVPPQQPSPTKPTTPVSQSAAGPAITTLSQTTTTAETNNPMVVNLGEQTSDGGHTGAIAGGAAAAVLLAVFLITVLVMKKRQSDSETKIRSSPGTVRSEEIQIDNPAYEMPQDTIIVNRAEDDDLQPENEYENTPGTSQLRGKQSISNSARQSSGGKLANANHASGHEHRYDSTSHGPSIVGQDSCDELATTYDSPLQENLYEEAPGQARDGRGKGLASQCVKQNSSGKVTNATSDSRHGSQYENLPGGAQDDRGERLTSNGTIQNSTGQLTNANHGSGNDHQYENTTGGVRDDRRILSAARQHFIGQLTHANGAQPKTGGTQRPPPEDEEGDSTYEAPAEVHNTYENTHVKTAACSSNYEQPIEAHTTYQNTPTASYACSSNYEEPVDLSSSYQITSVANTGQVSVMSQESSCEPTDPEDFLYGHHDSVDIVDLGKLPGTQAGQRVRQPAAITQLETMDGGDQDQQLYDKLHGESRTPLESNSSDYALAGAPLNAANREYSEGGPVDGHYTDETYSTLDHQKSAPHFTHGEDDYSHLHRDGDQVPGSVHIYDDSDDPYSTLDQEAPSRDESKAKRGRRRRSKGAAVPGRPTNK